MASNLKASRNSFLNEKHTFICGAICLQYAYFIRYQGGVIIIVKILIDNDGCMVNKKSYVRVHTCNRFVDFRILLMMIEHSHLIIDLHKFRKCIIQSWIFIVRITIHNS